MIRLTFFFISCLCSISAWSQCDSLSNAEIATCSYTFTLKDEALSGPGADTLRKAITGSQFFLLGEYHGDKGICRLTEALLPELKKEGYEHFGLEIGPFSAQKLKSLIEDPSSDEAFAAFFNEQAALTGEVPIPFFEHHEDISFLQKAADEGFAIWGLDQEFLGAYLFLLEELWQDAGSPEQWASAYEGVRLKLIEYYTMSHDPEAYDGSAEALEVYNQLLNDSAFDTLCEQLAQRILNGEDRVDAMMVSFEIYRNWRANRIQNLEGRSQLMKRYFMEAYRASNQRFPKVLVKMGGIHTSRGFTQNASYELGNMLSELAHMNGNHSVHLSFATRYFYDPEAPDSIGDNLVYRNDWMNAMRPLLLQAKTDEWTLVDLRAVRKIWINGRRCVGSALRTLLESHDFIVLMPPFPDPEPHFDLSLVRE